MPAMDESTAAIVQIHPAHSRAPSHYQQQPIYYQCPHPHHDLNPTLWKNQFADPGPLGLFAFACIAVLSGSVHAKMFGDGVDGDAIFSPAIIYAGIIQLVAGMIDFYRGNQLGGSTFLAFGAYWLCNGLWSLPLWSIKEMYAENMDQFKQMRGVFILCFVFIALSTTLADVNNSIFQTSLMGLVVFDFLLLAINNFWYNRSWEIFLGYVFILTGILAYYEATAYLLAAHTRVRLPLGRFANRRKRNNKGSQEDIDLEKFDLSTRHESRLK